MIKGSCLCGGVKFEITRAVGPFELCHCSRCRKANGSAFVAGLGVRRDDFRLLQSRELIKTYEAPIRENPPVYPIVGAGAGAYSYIDLRDAAAATIKVLAHEARGIYNIVNDAPVRLSEWLPIAAKLLGAPAPGHMDEALARQKVGDMRVYYMNEQRGASNAKAKREFNWQPAFPSWRTGFEELYFNRPLESSPPAPQRTAAWQTGQPLT